MSRTYAEPLDRLDAALDELAAIGPEFRTTDERREFLLRVARIKARAAAQEMRVLTDHEPMEEQQAPQSAEGEAKVITLCGSTKFEAEFAEVNRRLTMEGCVVLSLGMFSLPDLPGYDWMADSSDLKGRLGHVNFQKIRMADEVYVVQPGGYSVSRPGGRSPTRSRSASGSGI